MKQVDGTMQCNSEKSFTLCSCIMSACPTDGGGPSPSVSERDLEVDCGLFQKQSPGLDSGSRRMGMLSVGGCIYILGQQHSGVFML